MMQVSTAKTVARPVQKSLVACRLLPRHAAPARESVVEAKKRRRVDHREIERKHEDLGPETPQRAPTGQQIEKSLPTERGPIERRGQKKNIGDQRRKQEQRNQQAGELVRDEEEERQ